MKVSCNDDGIAYLYTNEDELFYTALGVSLGLSNDDVEEPIIVIHSENGYSDDSVRLSELLAGLTMYLTEEEIQVLRNKLHEIANTFPVWDRD